MALLDILNALQNNEETIVKAYHLGNLEVPTGYIVACDPLTNPERPAFERQTPKGKFPVRWLLDDDREVCYAQLLFSNKPIVRIEMATLEGQDLDDLEEGYIFGYPVDAGLGCFMDEESAELLLEIIEDLEQNDDYISYYDDVLDDELLDQDYCNHFPDKDSPLNVLVFRSGWGDGSYPSYWGFDEAGEIVTLVTDFGLIADEEEDGKGEHAGDSDV